MSRHDIHFVDTEAQTHVQYHIQQPPRSAQLHELLLATSEQTRQEQHQKKSFYSVIKYVSVRHNHWSIAQNVL